MNKSRFIRFSFLFAAATGLDGTLAARAVGPLQFYSVTPCRLADTRGANGVNGGPVLSHGAVRSFAVYSAPANWRRPQRRHGQGRHAGHHGRQPDQPRPSDGVPLPHGGPGGLRRSCYGAGEPALGNGAIVPITNDDEPPDLHPAGPLRTG